MSGVEPDAERIQATLDDLEEAYEVLKDDHTELKEANKRLQDELEELRLVHANCADPGELEQERKARKTAQEEWHRVQDNHNRLIPQYEELKEWREAEKSFISALAKRLGSPEETDYNLLLELVDDHTKLADMSWTHKTTLVDLRLNLQRIVNSLPKTEEDPMPDLRVPTDLLKAAEDIKDWHVDNWMKAVHIFESLEKAGLMGEFKDIQIVDPGPRLVALNKALNGVMGVRVKRS